jgi:WD40 repeat protein
LITKIKNNLFLFLLLFSILWIVAYLFYIGFFAPKEVMVVSVSSDGNYAISTGLREQAILWDIKHKTYKFLDRKSNIYSAYFIKNTNYYMWQHDPDNEVYIKDTKGNLIEHFNPGFPTYGQVITSDLKNYFASDEDFNLFKISDNVKIKITPRGSAGGFLGVGKLLNLTLSNDDKYLLNAGSCVCWGSDGCISGSVQKIDPNIKEALSDLVLWEVITGKPIYRFLGNVVKTYATLSPDGKYVLSGDENGLGFVWQINGIKNFKLSWLQGKAVKNSDGTYRWDSNGMIKKPKDFGNDDILSIKFIDLQGDYLRFTTYVPYAILYNINDPKPLKYLPLGKHPFPSVDDYSRNASIDTAPAANILVMGKANSGGILVYKFDPIKQTLTKIWDGD